VHVIHKIGAVKINVLIRIFFKNQSWIMTHTATVPNIAEIPDR
jgi:hypothetical protein